MVADDVFLGTQDKRHRLVDDIIAKHEHGLFLIADGVRRAGLKVDRAAENLLRRVLERAGRVDLALRVLAIMVDDDVDVDRLTAAAEIADLRRIMAAVADKLRVVVRI